MKKEMIALDKVLEDVEVVPVELEGIVENLLSHINPDGPLAEGLYAAGFRPPEDFFVGDGPLIGWSDRQGMICC